MHGRETLSALFPDEASGERAMERLRALGVPEESMELHPTNEGGVTPEGQVTVPFGLGGLLAPAMLPETPRPATVVVVATGVPGELVTEARRILDAEASEVEESADPPARPDERWDG